MGLLRWGSLLDTWWTARRRHAIPTTPHVCWCCGNQTTWVEDSIISRNTRRLYEYLQVKVNVVTSCLPPWPTSANWTPQKLIQTNDTDQLPYITALQQSVTLWMMKASLHKDKKKTWSNCWMNTTWSQGFVWSLITVLLIINNIVNINNIMLLIINNTLVQFSTHWDQGHQMSC